MKEWHILVVNMTIGFIIGLVFGWVGVVVMIMCGLLNLFNDWADNYV